MTSRNRVNPSENLTVEFSSQAASVRTKRSSVPVPSDTKIVGTVVHDKLTETNCNANAQEMSVTSYEILLAESTIQKFSRLRKESQE